MVGHVACMGEMRNTIFLLENLKGQDHFEDLSVDGTIILRWSHKNNVGNCGLDSSGSV
jgi:hypothetical protein